MFRWVCLLLFEIQVLISSEYLSHGAKKKKHWSPFDFHHFIAKQYFGSFFFCDWWISRSTFDIFQASLYDFHRLPSTHDSTVKNNKARKQKIYSKHTKLTCWKVKKKTTTNDKKKQQRQTHEIKNIFVQFTIQLCYWKLFERLLFASVYYLNGTKKTTFWQRNDFSFSWSW